MRVELECKQIWWSPGVWEVKVKRPSEPYCLDSTTCGREKACEPHCHASRVPTRISRGQPEDRQSISWAYLAVGVLHFHMHA